MARHDTKRGTQRAISQDNTTGVQKLNEELRKLKEDTDREALDKTATKRTAGNTRKPKS
jgi:hypothetical protein